MNPLIKIKSNYVELLENECIKNKYPLPVYMLLSQTKDENNLNNYYSVQCNAMDFIAIGNLIFRF